MLKIEFILVMILVVQHQKRFNTHHQQHKYIITQANIIYCFNSKTYDSK